MSTRTLAILFVCAAAVLVLTSCGARVLRVQDQFGRELTCLEVSK